MTSDVVTTPIAAHPLRTAVVVGALDAVFGDLVTRPSHNVQTVFDLRESVPDRGEDGHRHVMSLPQEVDHRAQQNEIVERVLHNEADQQRP